MQNRFSHIRLVATKAETAFAELLVITCEFVLGENISHLFRVSPLFSFSAISNQYFRRYGQAATLAKMSIVNDQQQGQQQNQQNSSWNSNREK